MWRRAAEVLSLQGCSVGAASAGVVLSPLGVAWVAVGVGGGLIVGAWLWATLRGRREAATLELQPVRAISVRCGAVAGVVVGVAYAAVGLQPGQLQLEPPGVLLAAAVFTIAAGLTSAGLTLCGLDLGRPQRL